MSAVLQAEPLPLSQVLCRQAMQLSQRWLFSLQQYWRDESLSSTQHQARLALYSLLLHEPQSRCRKILRRHAALQQWLEWQRHRAQSPGEIRYRRESVRWSQCVHYQQVGWQQGASRIMAAFHFGDYVHCLTPLARADVPWRRRILIRQQTGSDQSEANLRLSYAQLGLDPPVLLQTGQFNLLRLRQQLRNQLCTLTTFCDLPARFGVPVEVRFLGQPAWFSCGTAALAISAGVPILPVITWQQGWCNQLHVAPPLSSELLPGECQQQACQRITQALVRLLEQWLLQYPEQWRFLARLPEYLRPPPATILSRP